MSDESAPEQRAYAGPATKRGFAEWCMFLAVGTPSRLWKHTPKSFEDGRKLTVNVAILGVGILLAIVLVKSTLETTTIVEPAAVPQALVDRGYTGTIIAQRLIDQVDVIDKTAKTSKEHIQFAHESRFAALSTLQVPAAGVTVQSVVTILRNLLRREDDRIGSELTIKPPTGGSKTETYELLLRFEIGSERFVIVVASPDVDQLIRRGSQAIVGKRDPYTLASYLYGRREWLQVDTLLDQLVVAADLKDRKWVLNLRGLRYADHGDYEEALRYYKKATDLDPDFAVALTNSGNALSSLGRRSEALKTYHAAIAKNPRLAQARVGLAITLARDDLPAAFTLLQEAIEQNPREPLPYNVRGNLERDQGNFKSAFENYGTAVGLDPEYALAYNG
jgi:Flp pilus assembly protein TadD